MYGGSRMKKVNSGRILLVEDEAKIAEAVRLYLERDGFAVTIVSTGAAALEAIREEFDLVILDLMLPDMRGEDICSALREFSDIPIIMLTAKSSEDDRIAGLGIGADDYVVKPFSPRELVARVKAHLRRTQKAARTLLSFNSRDLLIDGAAHEVQKNGRPIALTSTEYRILLCLAEHPDLVFSRQQLINAVQGIDFEGFDRVVDAHIKNIRQKIEDTPQQPAYIRTVYGVGYRFGGRPDA